MTAKTRRARWFVGGLALSLWLALPLVARADEAQAMLNPSSISVDDSAELRLPSQGNDTPEPPAVPGLVFQQAGQSTEMSVINGKVSQHTWTLYQVAARRPGIYRIPFGAQQLTLTVGPAGQGGHAGATAGAQSSAESSTAEPSAAGAPLAFLRTQFPRGKFYVGQAIPVAFKAYFRPGTEVTIAAPPSLGNPTFTVSDVSEKPVPGTQTIGGQEYATATWTALISGTMPGTSSTEVTMPIEVRYREAARPRGSAFGDPFGGSDPFADDPMASSMFKSMLSSGFGSAFQGFEDPFGPVRQREMTLHSPAEGLTLLPLPLAGRPQSFGGAVGQFEVATQLTPAAAVAFEPMSLQIAVSGQGNFDRVAVSGLESTPDFKTYPGSTTFASRNPHSTFSGTKTFVQPVVPERAGTLTLPPVSFSYFDPKTSAYVTKTSEPLPVIAAAGAATGQSAATLQTPTSQTGSAATAEGTADGLRPNHLASDDGATLTVPDRKAWFWGALVLPLLALGLATVISRRRGRGPSASAQKRELRATLNAQRKEMRTAVERRDALGFFNAAHAAVQTELGQLWHLSPEAVTDAEVRLRLGEKGRPLADTLHMADAVLYGGARVVPDSLSGWDSTVEALLDQLEVVS